MAKSHHFPCMNPSEGMKISLCVGEETMTQRDLMAGLMSSWCCEFQPMSVWSIALRVRPSMIP